MTRLLKHGEDGKTVEIVAVSWTAKPCDRSSRNITFKVPPGLPGGIGVGAGTRVEGSSPFFAAGAFDSGLEVWAVDALRADASSVAPSMMAVTILKGERDIHSS